MRAQDTIISTNFTGEGKPQRWFMLVILLVLGGVGEAAAAHNTPADDSDIVVIVSPESQLDDLTVNKLRSIFSMRKPVDSAGNSLRVYVLQDDDPTHVLFSKEVLHTFPFNLRRIWNRKIYSGTGQSPTVVHSEQEMREKVTLYKNAIGYVSREMVNKDIKVVNIR